MLTENQVEIVNNWDEEHEGRKKGVRKKLIDSLSDLPFLRKLPPYEAREVVQSAILNYAELDNRSELGEKEKNEPPNHIYDELIIHNCYDTIFIKKSITVLFNSVFEKSFEQGVNHGIEDTVRWWKDADTGEKSKFVDVIDKDYPVRHTRFSDGFCRSKTKSLSEPPEFAGEKIHIEHTGKAEIPNRLTLARIFYLRSRKDLIRPNLLDAFVKNDIFDIDVEELEEYIIDGENEAWNDDSINSTQNIFDNEITNAIIDAKNVINESRKLAEDVARYFSNPTNSVFNIGPHNSPNDNTPIVRWHLREQLELHRDYLKTEGLLPEESKIIDYPKVHIGVPDPSELDLKSWNKDMNIR